MSLVKVFIDAHETLGTEPGVERRALKRAYRRAVQAHPPDRDPDGFRRIRDAYELLADPHERASALLRGRRPAVDPPPLPPLPPPGASAVAVLRAAVSTIPVEWLLEDDHG